MINPATQNNKIKTYLLLDAFKESEQNLDETEEINIRLIDFELLETLIKSNEIKTQLFTANAYYMARIFLSEN